MYASQPSNGPLVKRQRLSGPATAMSTPSIASGSAIFAPFRTVGLVSPTSVPFTSIPLGKTTFQVTTSVGRCLQTYDLKRGLNLVFITRPQTPADVTATYAWKDRVFAAWGQRCLGTNQGLWVYQRGKKVAELELPKDLDQPIKQISVFGSWIVGCALTRIEVWKSTTYEHYTTLFTTASKKGDNELTGGVCNMPTYLNKILAGRKDGWVEIWNVSTGKLIYTILPPVPNCGSVTCMEPTPALALLAISYSRGLLIIHDILTDKMVVAVTAGNEEAPVTSISFRTDGLGAGQDGRKEGVMATATAATGDVTFWDLNEGGRVMGVLRSAHNPPLSRDGGAAVVGGGTSKIQFLPGQPVIVTSGHDNSLKSWVFDESPFSSIPRILHCRSGHAGPVQCLRFLPSDFDGPEAGNKWLLSADQDRSLWGWSLRRDGQSTELSQGALRKKAKKYGILSHSTLARGPTTTLDDLKAPEITCMASSLNRDGGISAMPGNQAIWQKGNNNHIKKAKPDAEVSGMTGWESVITGHKDDAWARTWFWGRKRAGRWAFPTGDGRAVSSVAITSCGTFGLVGSCGGSLDMFNMQSGIHRRQFPSRLTPAQARQFKMQQLKHVAHVQQQQQQLKPRSTSLHPRGSGKHRNAVTDIVVDSLNQFVVSCSLDGTVKFWDFLTGNLVDELNWPPTVQITRCRYHAANDLIAFSCSDHSIKVVDIVTRKVIRVFASGQADINDFCFSHDGRWIVTASQDALLRVWDLLTSHLIDAVRLEKPYRALDMSVSGEYLAAARQGELGVDIWTNRTLYKHVPTKKVSEKQIATISAAPTASGEGGQGLLEAAVAGAEEDVECSENEDSMPTPIVDQLSKDLTTLSLVPRSRWQTLLHLDLIKQRNKPTEAPKVPERSAPFFLPSATSRTDLTVKGMESMKEALTGMESRILKFDRRRAEEDFTLKLRAGASSGIFDDFIDYLKSLSPSTADLELRSLSLGDVGDDTTNELLHFIRALTSRLMQRRDYELTQTWMAVFLRLHCDVVMENVTLIDALRTWKLHQERERDRLNALVGYCAGVVGFLRSPRTS